MIQPAFNIGDSDRALELSDGRLLIEISAQWLNYILFTKDPHQLLLLRQYRLYTTGDRSAPDLINEVFDGDNFIQQHASRALIVYNFPEADIVPNEFYNDSFKEKVTRLVHGDDNTELVFGEEIRDMEMHNVYRVPKDIHLLLKEKFKAAGYWHIYTLMLLFPSVNHPEKKNILRIVFYHDKFIVVFYSHDKLLLVQTFNYQTPEDAAYYLLLICKQFNISGSDVSLYVSGLIDSESALYSELQKYFSEVHEEGYPEGININGLLEEFPAHYFSPLLKMSLCGL